MHANQDSHRYLLPGGKVSVSSLRDLARIGARGAWLLGPGYWRLMNAAGSRDRSRIHDAERYWMRQAARAARVTIEAHGTHKIVPGEQYVLAPLHEGFADVLALNQLPLDLAYSAAGELFEWRFLGSYLRASEQSPVPIDNGALAYRLMLRAADKAFARGESFVVFPQGSILGIETAFHQGAFRMSARSGRSLLPVVLTGGASVWEYPYSTRLNLGATIRLEVLDPIDSTEVLHCARGIEAEMKERALAAVPGPRRFDPERDGWWDDYRYEIDPSFDELAAAVDRRRSR